jgi:hypothetical protein
MKLADHTLRIPAQIWAVLNVLAENEFGFYDLGVSEKKEEKWDAKTSVATFPFYNFPGRAYGFVIRVKNCEDSDILYFTVTEHGACDEICVVDWTTTDSTVPLIDEQRPETARCVNFRFADVGNVVEYVRRLIASYLDGNHGVLLKGEYLSIKVAGIR